MKTIIAGGRNITDYNLVLTAIKESGFTITEVVSGRARGVDTLGEKWAYLDGPSAIKYFPADWTKHGRSAGPKRNRQMAQYSDALIAIWDGKSRGTKHMIDVATELALKVYIYRTD